MGADAWDWVNLLLRWSHVMLGIAWIGASFYFVWLDASLAARRARRQALVAGGSWMVHGGGFYHNPKVLVAPAALPQGAALVQIRGLFHLDQRLPAAGRGLLSRRQ